MLGKENSKKREGVLIEHSSRSPTRSPPPSTTRSPVSRPAFKSGRVRSARTMAAQSLAITRRCAGQTLRTRTGISTRWVRSDYCAVFSCKTIICQDRLGTIRGKFQRKWCSFRTGVKAAAGYSVFCRQDFVGIDYGVGDSSGAVF